LKENIFLPLHAKAIFYKLHSKQHSAGRQYAFHVKSLSDKALGRSSITILVKLVITDGVLMPKENNKIKGKPFHFKTQG
jgi:hypothetical protein